MRIPFCISFWGLNLKFMLRRGIKKCYEFRWIFSFCILDLQNFYGTLHGGSVASFVESLSTACARTVVAEDKELFLGEITLSYLSAAPINVSSVYWISKPFRKTCQFMVAKKVRWFIITCIWNISLGLQKILKHMQRDLWT